MNLTDSTGSKVASYNYKSFGEMRLQSGTVSNSWLFTGRQFDPESGMYFNRNRFYDPRIARFITQDPSLTLNPHNRVIPYLLLNQLSNPLELHRYLYCINNPVNLIDPLGLELRYSWTPSDILFWVNQYAKFTELLPYQVRAVISGIDAIVSGAGPFEGF